MRAYSYLLFLLFFSGLSGQVVSDNPSFLFQKYLESYGQGQFIEARNYLAEIIDSDYSLSDYHNALINNSLGLVHWNLGQYHQAKRYYEIAIDICQKDTTASLDLQILIYNNIAILYRQQGEYQLAIEHYDNSESLLHTIGIKDTSYFDRLSKIRFNKALVYYNLKEYTKALEINCIAADLKSKYNLPYLGNVYFNIAQCYEKTSNPNKADSYYITSITHWLGEGNQTHHELGKIYLEYGQFLSDQGDDSLALNYFNKALKNYISNYGIAHTYTAGCYTLIADFYTEQNEFVLALENVQWAFKSLCPGFTNMDIAVNPTGIEPLLELRLLKIYRSKIRALTAYANSILDHENNSTKAVELFGFAAETNKEAVRVLGRIQESYLTQESRLYLLENQTDIFISGIEIALQLFNLTEEQKYQEMAHQFSSAGKAFELQFEMREKNALYLNNLQDSTSSDLVAIKENIDNYTNLIQMEQMKAGSDSLKISSWQQERFDLRRSYELKHKELFDEAISTGSEEWFETQGEETTIQTIQSKLRRKETLIEYSISDPDFSGNRDFFAFVISKSSSRVYQAVLDTSFSSDIEVVSDHLYNFRTGSFKKESTIKLKEALNNLFVELIDPIEPWFTGDRLIIVPGGELLHVPFDALVRTKPKADDQYSSRSYLVRDYQISYLPASKFMFDRNFKLIRRSPGVTILAQDYSDGGESDIRSLSAVTDEVDAIQEIMNSKMLPGDESKKYIHQEIEGSQLLHFALHSYPSSEDQDASYLILNSRSDSAYTNLLFDYEIEPLNLSSDMVVLNSCESGGGRHIDGEGMMSFSRSFILGGAKSVVHALWPVDDRAGTHIISQFYKGLSKGSSKPKALQKAKINYLNKCLPTFAHPYFWAGYQVIGDTNPVSTPYSRPAMGMAVLLLLGILLSRKRVKYKKQDST